MRKSIPVITMRAVILVAFICTALGTICEAQVRGQYTVGFSATNSGVLPESGFTYANTFQLYSFNQLKDRDGNRLPVSGDLSILIDHNLFAFVAKKKVLGAKFAMLADLPIANNSLTSSNFGAVAGGGGLTDSYFQPFTLGWSGKRYDVFGSYGFVAPTGRFNGGATNNVGTGYWGNDLSSGQTFYLTKNKGTAVSAYEQYEFHGTQRDTQIHPGQTFDLDYSLTQMVPLQKDEHTLLQVGLIGYGQFQTLIRAAQESRHSRRALTTE